MPDSRFEYMGYYYNHKKDTRAGTCHYDIIDPVARFVVGWSEYGPFLLSPFSLRPSLYIPDFATPSVQPFRVAFLTDISVKLSGTSFPISVLCNPKSIEIHASHVLVPIFQMFNQLHSEISLMFLNRQLLSLYY